MTRKMVPTHLLKTYNMLCSAFREELKEDMYFAVLYYLYEHMSDRNIAEVMSLVTAKDIGLIYNDLIKSISMKHDEFALNKVKELLTLAGYNKWIEEES